MADTPQISRRRHYFYVLVFSVVVWDALAVLFSNITFLDSERIWFWLCECHRHYKVFLNINLIIYSIAGIGIGFIFSYPLHRIILVSNSKPEDEKVPLSWLPNSGKIMSLRYGMGLILVIIGFFFIGLIFQNYLGKYRRAEIFEITLLQCAVGRGDVDEVLERIEAGDDIDAMHGLNQLAALHCAVFEEHLNIVKILVEHGANINIRTTGGYTALNIACQVGCIDIVKYLCENGADIHSKSAAGISPLHTAICCRHKDIADYLVSIGVDINVKTSFGKTLLHLCSSIGDKETSAYLIQNGLDVNAKCSDGRTPLHDASFADIDCVMLLIESGANVNAKDVDGDTPLHSACQNADSQLIIKYLLTKGAKINALNTFGQTPLDKAHGYGNAEFMKFLRSLGAKKGVQMKQE
ncbi:MAG: ankyrin repeat domain-containing protein [Planctomycetota bacterium]